VNWDEFKGPDLCRPVVDNRKKNRTLKVDGYLHMKVEKPVLGSSAEDTLTRIKKNRMPTNLGGLVAVQ
jgi:hypothetical protein